VAMADDTSKRKCAQPIESKALSLGISRKDT
jgi:hypothetical protein